MVIVASIAVGLASSL